MTAEPVLFLCLGKACFQRKAIDVRALQVDWGKIQSFLCLASLIFHVYEMKIKVADSEGWWTSKEENFIAILHPFFFCMREREVA